MPPATDNSDRTPSMGSQRTRHATNYQVMVAIGGLYADILYAGRAPGFIGLMQINARVPAGLTAAVPCQ